ncbi:phosphoribosyltransferase family protein [Utexia brackfieldae]|uniref:phosphoribosyltransferase family protein n=1 Tax=Utexia brackfieldae TaxID=3074108 RepID=UPI00370D5287
MIGFLQTRCFLCHLSLRLSQHGICSYCLKQLTAIDCPCLLCSLPSFSTPVCYSCRHKSPLWSILMAVTAYREPLKQLVHQLKFNRRIELSYLFGRLLLLRWLDYRRIQGLQKPDLVLSVPLSQRRQAQRGFNQTALMAKLVAYWLDCDYSQDQLIRKKLTPDQKYLSARDRRANLHNAFDCQDLLSGKRILLVDDIVTTGSTIDEICQVLARNGAKDIQVICLCRTL